jgi:hypothetical protein
MRTGDIAAALAVRTMAVVDCLLCMYPRMVAGGAVARLALDAAGAAPAVVHTHARVLVCGAADERVVDECYRISGRYLPVQPIGRAQLAQLMVEDACQGGVNFAGFVEQVSKGLTFRA